MNGRTLTLGLVGALALGAAVLRRGVPGSADVRPSVLGGPVYAGGDYAALRDLAYALKQAGSTRIEEAADVLVAKLPRTVRGPSVVLVPVPSSKGDTTLNLRLAEAVAARIGATVVDALHGPERQSSRDRKKAGLPGLRAQQMPMTLRAQRQVDLAGSVYLVDNVLDTGETLRAAERALGRPVGAMVLAVTIRPEGSRAVSGTAVPDAVREEARTASAWFRERARAWHARDVEAGREDFIGLDDMGLLLPTRMRALQKQFGDRLLGHGVFRAVVASSDPRFVIKLAMRPADNLDEAGFWAHAGPETRALLVPVVAVDPEGYWLVMERVEPLPWAPGVHPAIRAVQQRAEGVGLVDIHADNLSSDLRILDYAEPVSSRGTPNTRKPR